MSRELLNRWLLSLRESDGLKVLLHELEKEKNQAGVIVMNKARAEDNAVFYQAGVHDGIEKVIALLQLPLKSDANPDT